MNPRTVRVWIGAAVVLTGPLLAVGTGNETSPIYPA